MEIFPQVIVNVEVREKKDLNELATVGERIREVEEKLGEEGRTNYYELGGSYSYRLQE